jgi:hypothetical protein
MYFHNNIEIIESKYIIKYLCYIKKLNKEFKFLSFFIAELFWLFLLIGINSDRWNYHLTLNFKKKAFLKSKDLFLFWMKNVKILLIIKLFIFVRQIILGFWCHLWLIKKEVNKKTLWSKDRECLLLNKDEKYLSLSSKRK